MIQTLFLYTGAIFLSDRITNALPCISELRPTKETEQDRSTLSETLKQHNTILNEESSLNVPKYKNIHLFVTKNRRFGHIEQRYVLDLRKIKTQKKTFEIHHLTDNNQKR